MSRASVGDSSKSSEEGESDTPSDSSSGQSSKRPKAKSKVWDRVAWFSRKHRSREAGDGASSQLCKKKEACECCEADTSLQSRQYPNSEIVVQNCLKPSVARALFMQLESTGGSWKTTKQRDDEALSLSLPDGIDASEERVPCHCMACCSCSPSQRLLGSCPVFSFIRRSNSAASLDTMLTGITNDQPPCHDNKANILLPVGSFLTESSTDPLDPLLSADKTSKHNSLPTYYNRGLFKRCKRCDKTIALTQLPFGSTATESKPLIGESFCQCQKRQKPDSQPKDLNEVHTFRDKLQLMTQWFNEFDDAQRNLVLKQLLPQFNVPQIHLVSTEMEHHLHAGCPPNCLDSLGWLPCTVTSYLLTFLDPVSLGRVAMTCRRWNELASDTSLWRRFCNQPKWRLSRVSEHKQLLLHVQTNRNIDWKSVFAERFKLCNNWLKGKCNVRTFEGHTQGISCVQFDDTRIVSGSSDKTIKVWNIRTNSPWGVQTLAGHSGTVRCLHLDGNRLVSGSTDRSIKVWDLSTQQSWSSIACKVTMVGHLDTVRCLQVDDEKVVSGSYDRCLKVWDIHTGHCTRSLRGHEAAVLCVQFDQDKIVSGSCDKTIKVWKFSGECLMTLTGHHDAVTCLRFDKTRIVSGSLDCNLKFWHIDTGKCMNTIDWKASEGHTGVVRCLQVDSWRVVSASDDRTIKVWSLETGQRLVTLRNHTDGVTCLQFNDSIIVSGSYDKTVKLWDFGCC